VPPIVEATATVYMGGAILDAWNAACRKNGCRLLRGRECSLLYGAVATVTKGRNFGGDTRKARGGKKTRTRPDFGSTVAGGRVAVLSGPLAPGVCVESGSSELSWCPTQEWACIIPGAGPSGCLSPWRAASPWWRSWAGGRAVPRAAPPAIGAAAHWCDAQLTKPCVLSVWLD
jgi:hypothetical protein